MTEVMKLRRIIIVVVVKVIILSECIIKLTNRSILNNKSNTFRSFLNGKNALSAKVNDHKE